MLLDNANFRTPNIISNDNISLRARLRRQRSCQVIIEYQVVLMVNPTDQIWLNKGMAEFELQLLCPK